MKLKEREREKHGKNKNRNKKFRYTESTEGRKIHLKKQQQS